MSLGKQIANRYTILSSIGQGGFSEVYRAVALSSKDEYAIKVFDRRACSNSIADLMRFQNEAALISRLDHPNVVKLYETGEDQGFYYTVTEMVKGETLAGYLSSGKGFKLENVLEIMMEITKGLEYVHGVGIVHRDLKPENIAVCCERDCENENEIAKCSVKILDFGLAHLLDYTQIDTIEQIVGTFSYMSPEQSGIIGKSVDERSDLYSLGVIFYQMLASELPFSGNHIGEILHRQIATQPLKPSQLRNEIPDILDQIVLKLLNKDPEKRYQSARGLLADLSKVSRGKNDFVLAESDSKKLSYHTQLVGRETELNRLIELYKEASAGIGSVCFISGKAGEGKTRLIEQLRSYVYEQGGEVCSGTCLDQENRVPFQPFALALRQYINYLNKLNPNERENKIGRMKTGLGKLGGIMARLVPEVQDLVGETSAPANLKPERENARALRVYARFFLSLGEHQKPVVLVLDDLHWASEATLQLLKEMLIDISSYPVMVVGAYRDNEIKPTHGLNGIVQQATKSKYPLHRISLKSFAQAEMDILISELLFEKEANIYELSKYVLKNSKGNPFFAKEVVRRLVSEQAVFFDQEGRCQVDWERVARTDVPGSVIDTILHRAEELEEDLVTLLGYGAVIGRRFETELILHLGLLPNEKVVALLDKAAQHQFLEQGQQKGEFSFVHDRVRDAFYCKLSPEDLKKHHLRIAKTIEASGQGESERDMYRLAFHYHEAGEVDKSLLYSLPAAEKAKQKYANDEAIEYYRICVEAMEKKGLAGSPEWLAAKEGLVKVNLVTGKADQVIKNALEMLPFETTKAAMARIYSYLGTAYFKKGDWQRCNENVFKGLALLGEKVPNTKTAVILALGKEFFVHIMHNLFPRLFMCRENREIEAKYEEIVNFHFVVGWSFALNDTDKFLWNVLRMLNMSEAKLGDGKYLARLRAAYGSVCMAIALFDKAVQHLAEAEATLAEHGDEWGLAQCHQWYGWTYLWKGDHQRGIEYFAKSKDSFHKMGDTWEQTYSLIGLGTGYRYIGDYETSSKYFEECLGMSKRIEDLNGIATALTNLGFNCCETDHLAEAEDKLKQALQLAEEKKIDQVICTGSINLGYLFLCKGEYEKAIQCLLRAEKLHNKQKSLKDVTLKLYIYLAEAYIGKYRHCKFDWIANDKLLTGLHKVCKRFLRGTRSWPNNYGAALRVTAKYYALRGANQKAEHYFQRAIDYYETTVPIRAEAAKGYYSYGMWIMETDQAIRGKQLMAKAHTIFSDIGARRYLREINAIFGLKAEEQENQILLEDGLATSSQNRLTNLVIMKAIESINECLRTVDNWSDLAEKIMDLSMEVSGAQRGYLLMYVTDTKGNKTLQVVTGKGGEESELQDEMGISKEVVNRVTNIRKPLLVNDASVDESLRTNKSVILNKLRSIMCIPLIVGGQLLGMLYLDNTMIDGLFDKTRLELLTMFSVQLAIMMENSSLYTQLQGQKKIVGRDVGGKFIVTGSFEQFASYYKLTAREKDVLYLLLEGYGTQQIVEKLYITINTLRSHIKKIYKKLNINSQRELFKVFSEFTSEKRA